MAAAGNGGSQNETIFTMEATPLKYGPGASEEVGWEIKRMGVGRVMMISDPGVIETGITGRIQALTQGAARRGPQAAARSSARAKGSRSNSSIKPTWSRRRSRFRRRQTSPWGES